MTETERSERSERLEKQRKKLAEDELDTIHEDTCKLLKAYKEKEPYDRTRMICQQVLVMSFEVIIGNQLGFPPNMNVRKLEVDIEAVLDAWYLDKGANDLTSLLKMMEKIKLEEFK